MFYVCPNQSSAITFEEKLVLSPMLHNEDEMTPKPCFFDLHKLGFLGRFSNRIEYFISEIKNFSVRA